MIASIQSAWVTLRRPSVLLTAFGGSLAAALLATTVTFTSATDAPPTTQRPGPAIVTPDQLALPDGIVLSLTNGFTLLGMVAVSLGALAFASDFQHGTIRTLLVREPSRARFLAGKGIALGALLITGAATATAAGAALALALAPGAGVDTAAWSASAVLTGVSQVSAAMLGFGALGAGLGLLLRSTVAAIGLGIGWTFAIERLLSALWEGGEHVLPGELLADVSDGSLTAGGGAALACWLAALTGGALWSFIRRDIRI